MKCKVNTKRYTYITMEHLKPILHMISSLVVDTSSTCNMHGSNHSIKSLVVTWCTCSCTRARAHTHTHTHTTHVHTHTPHTHVHTLPSQLHGPLSAVNTGKCTSTKERITQVVLLSPVVYGSQDE